SSPAPALGRWAERIGRARADAQAAQRIGVLYVDGVGARAAAGLGGGCAVACLAASDAASDADAFADWLAACGRLVVAAPRAGVVEALAREPAVRRALAVHPGTRLAVAGLEPSRAAADLLAGVLREALGLLGAPVPAFCAAPGRIVPLGAGAGLAASDHAGPDAQQRLLAGALRGAIAAAEAGGAEALPLAPSADGGPLVRGLLGPAGGDGPGGLSPLSARIQAEFEGGDLGAVDGSVGAIKARIVEWFGRGRIWRAALMRVDETADSLVEGAVLDRSFEEAELGMVHAAGRLNAAVRGAASEAAGELGACAAQAGQPALLRARMALEALALQRAPVAPTALARHVWAARLRLSQSDVLGGVPRYIRWSLGLLWGAPAAALAGAVLLGAPLHYAAAGGAGALALALAWAVRRWARLQARLCRHVDAHGAALRAELAAAHRAALQTHLDAPVRGCIGDAAGALRAPPRRCLDPCAAGLAAEWRARLALATASTSSH
ncbi:hypothetical protein H4R18_003265, partial [Coemansia javaensis]